MPRYVLKVPDISCQHCKMRISKALEEIGEKDFEIHVSEKEVVIRTLNIERVLEKLKEIDYPVHEYTTLDTSH